MNTRRSVGATCMSWWSTSIAGDTGSSRRSRAQLRRADGTTAALCLATTHDLNLRLLSAGHDLRRRSDGPDRLALIAVALAHIASSGPDGLAKRFGHGSPPMLSGIRFNALIRAKAPNQLLRPLARSLRLVDRTANVAKLATDLYWWNDQVRTDWCFDYHGAANAEPTSEKENV